MSWSLELVQAQATARVSGSPCSTWLPQASTKRTSRIHTMHQYTKPLLEILAALPSGERVILAGHSLGGLNLALAMDKFPKKISVGVFIAAFMPDTTHRPSYVLDISGIEFFIDIKLKFSS
ncbi:hypothetical protein SLA2020_234790 [Shorea laevis]